MLADKREFLTALNNDPELVESIIRWQIYQTDLEEERIKLF